MNKLAVIKHYDPDTVDTVYIAAAAYGVKVVATEPTENKHEIQACICGPTENVRRMANDNAEGDLQPFESMRDLSDEEYEEWLQQELAKLGFSYAPKASTKDEDND